MEKHPRCDGIPSIPVCCPESCEVCGGPSCSNRPGGSPSSCAVNLKVLIVVKHHVNLNEWIQWILRSDLDAGLCIWKILVCLAYFPPLPRKFWGERCCHRAIVGSGRSCSSDVGPPCAMFDDSLLHPPATVVATTATTTSTSTTTTTLTTTTETVTTTTETVTTTTVTETSSTSSTQTLTWTTTTTTTLVTWTTTTVLTSSWTPWLEATVGTANKTNSSEFPGWNLKIWSCFWWFLVYYTDVQQKDVQTNLWSQRLESMHTSKRWSDRKQSANCLPCKSDWKFAASATWVAYIHMHGLNPDAWFSQTFKR